MTFFNSERSAGVDPEQLVEGTITAVRTQRKDTRRVSVEIDGRFAFGLNRDVASEFSLAKGKFLSVGDQKQIIDSESRARCYQSGLRILARRPHSVAELEKKLTDRGFREIAIQFTVAKLRDYGYLDDEKYALSFAGDRFRNRGFGPNRIRMELLSKGVSRDTISRVLEENFLDEDQLYKQAISLAEKKHRALQRELDVRKRRRKLQQFLFRKGYPSDLIYRIVNELS